MFGLYFLRYSDPEREGGFVDGGAAVAGAAEPCSRSLPGAGGRRNGESLWGEAVVAILIGIIRENSVVGVEANCRRW